MNNILDSQSYLETIKSSFLLGRAYYSNHARDEMLGEEFGIISDCDVEEALNSAQVLKSYAEDKPYPSLLVLGFTKKNRPLHIVCALAAETDTAIIITVYEPNKELWENNRERRKP